MIYFKNHSNERRQYGKRKWRNHDILLNRCISWINHYCAEKSILIAASTRSVDAMPRINEMIRFLHSSTRSIRYKRGFLPRWMNHILLSAYFISMQFASCNADNVSLSFGRLQTDSIVFPLCSASSILVSSLYILKRNIKFFIINTHTYLFKL